VHIGAATYENISAISNAMSSTLDKKEKWSPTPCDKVPTPGEKKHGSPHPVRKALIRDLRHENHEHEHEHEPCGKRTSQRKCMHPRLAIYATTFQTIPNKNFTLKRQLQYQLKHALLHFYICQPS
jgi:hypothetical protein